MVISNLVDSIFRLYWLLIIVRIFLTWVPSINWSSQPFKFLKLVVDPLLAPFRAFIPSLGGLDFSPIIAILFIQIVQSAIVQLLIRLGL